MKINSKSLGVVIPAYNEKESIAQLIAALLKIDVVGPIVVVDDSPTEETAKLVVEFKEHGVALIRRLSKGGRGSAVIEGLRHLTKNGAVSIFMEMDADFSHPPEQIPEIASALLEGSYDMVIASRYLPESQILNWPLSRRIFSRLANFLARIFLQIGITDYTNGYRCYSRRAAELIASEAGKYGNGFIALSEILVRLKLAGYSIGEVPTQFINRVRGESSVGWSEISQSLTGLFKITWFYWSSRISK